MSGSTVKSPIGDETGVARSTNRLDFLDGIRGVGAALVVIQHLFETWFPSFATWSQAWIHPGRVGVVAFFVVSGYVVALTLSKQTVATFATRRFWRLYPVYWVATVIWVLVDVSTGDAWSGYGIFVIAANALMIQGALGMTSILGTGWTLGMEVFFYAQAAVSKKLGRLAGSAYLGLAWLAAFAALALVNKLLGAHYGYLMPVMLIYAALGFSLYFKDVGRGGPWMVLLLASTVGVGALSFPFLWAYDERNPFSVFSFNASHLAGLAIFFVFRAVKHRSVSKALLWLGGLSYALYLIHVPVMMLFYRGGVPAWLGIPSATAASLVAAMLLRHYVERPSIWWGRKLSDRRP